jgi:hypothetical protein
MLLQQQQSLLDIITRDKNKRQTDREIEKKNKN